jgi:hypothetical protein
MQSPRGLLATLLATILVLGAAIPVLAADPHTRIDLYFASGYERQVDGRTCTAASAAMMLNFSARHDLHLRQLRILRYAQPRDALNDRVQRGSDALGWSRAATAFAHARGIDTRWKWSAYPTKTAALRAAARAIAKTHRPVGLSAWNGRHAIVMTGFTSAGDPATGSFRLLTVIVSDPYWSGPIGSRHRAYTPSALPFGRYLELDATRAYDRAWYRHWVIVEPVYRKTPSEPTPTPAPTPTPVPSDEPTATPAPSDEPTATPAPSDEPTGEPGGSPVAGA